MAECELVPLISRFGLNPPSQGPTGLNSFFTGGAGSTGGTGGAGGRGGKGSVGAGGPSVGVWCERSAVPLAQVQVLVSAADGGFSAASLNCQ